MINRLVQPYLAAKYALKVSVILSRNGNTMEVGDYPSLTEIFYKGRHSGLAPTACAGVITIFVKEIDSRFPESDPGRVDQRNRLLEECVNQWEDVIEDIDRATGIYKTKG